MQLGLAMPIAIAAIAGTILGNLALPDSFEMLGLAVLLLARSRLALGLLLVASLTAMQIGMAREAQLPQGLSGVDVRLEGRVLSYERQGMQSRMLLQVSDCRPLEASRLPCDRVRRVRLSLYEFLPLKSGEVWRLTARLRPPRGFSNPHAVDYGAWLWREGIDATGYLRSDPAPRRLQPASPSLRDAALNHLEAQPLSDLSRRWLAALTLGEGERLDTQDWSLLNDSGTTHLVVVSGLHVGLVGTFSLLLARLAARALTPRRWRMAVWPWWLAALACIGYVWLAGFEPPALRALLMTLVGLWVASGRHAPGPWQGWWLALGLVILVDPLGVWRPGLWLSFVAVALLILVWQRRPRPRGVRGWAWGLLRTQWLLAPLMTAAVLLAFDRIALAGPLVNLLAVPLVSSVLVPLGLSGWLLSWIPPLSLMCWRLFGGLVALLQDLLESAVTLFPSWTPEAWLRMPLALALVAMALAWALPGVAMRLRLAMTCVLALLPFTIVAPRIEGGDLMLRVHDVGQGQLIDIRTASHRLLFDTGPRFRSGFMPLESLWPDGQHFDRVVVSHADLDHAGGIGALESHDVTSWMAPARESLEISTEPCRAGERWTWDGVTFQFLWPPTQEDALWKGNDASCVLMVQTQGHRVLITGDVGRDVERRFVREVGGVVDLLVAGHHGSRSSSGPQLVQMLSPRHVVFSAGRDNAFGHPHPSVVRRFRRQASCLWSTALDGAVTFEFSAQRGVQADTRRELPGSAVDGACHRVNFGT
ncbi:DNA internalization-related competence protein ComEC/Rec2 [Litchfieldella xinjiangensis]|uniref:DNA internalization-related competence protein ComEC/Rec2 n=1 Tax=Litchfieldella xinjiangensis TaxID=1166948 RepID=UPI0006932B6E|nr:DNA internalization-related competence protein ComEC/Rec2 [Halomonas xinjiangensis]